MSIRKLIGKELAGGLILLSICMGVLNTHAQYKLSLGDSAISLTDGNGVEISMDTLNNDSISITAISIDYKDHSKDRLRIWNEAGKLLFSKDATNGFDTEELEKNMPDGIKFYSNTSYVIQHNDKKWDFIYGTVSPVIDPDELEEETQESSNPGDKEVPIVIYILLGVLALSTILFGGLCFVLSKKIKIQSKREDGSEKAGADYSRNTGSSVDKKDFVEEGDSADQNKDLASSLTSEDITADKVLDELCGPGYSNCGLSLVQKKIRLEQKLGERDRLKDIQMGLCSLLGIKDTESEDCGVMLHQKIHSLLEDIDSLRSNNEKNKGISFEETSKEDEKSESGIKEIYDSLVENSRKNYDLKPIVEKAQKKYKSTKDSEKDIIIDVIVNLSNKEKKASPITDDSNIITDAQLNALSNRDKLREWLVAKLKLYGVPVPNRYARIEELLTGIAQELQAAEAITIEESYRKSDEEIISIAIKEDRLSDKDRRILLERMVTDINSCLPDSSKKMKSDIRTKDFVELVASRLSTPSDHEEAMNQVKERNISVINEVFGSDITDLTRDQLKMIAAKSVVSIVNKELGISVDTLEEAKKKLREINSTMSDLQKKYGVDNPSQLEKVIIDKKFEQVQKSVAPEVEKLLPGEHFDSIQKLVNALIKVAKDNKESYEHAKEADELVQDSLQESIAIMNQNVLTEGKSLLELVDIYNTEISNKTKVWNEERDGLIQNNETSLLQLSEKIKENESLNKDKESLQDKLKDESSEMVTYLHAATDKIRNAWRPILKGCSEEDENQCIDIENRLRNNLFESLKSFERYKATDDLNPSQTRKEIQNILIEKLTAENSPFNIIGRYYAYSRLPFMTDTAREYGVIFNRRNIGVLYSTMEALYVHFGINLDIPVLFAMGIEEGDFINATGKAYGDLDNLCQNSRNHFDNIDSKIKPSEVIVDLVQVGYSLPERPDEGKKPIVLTY